MYECIKGRLYEIDGRNFNVALYDGEGGFIGICQRFGIKYLFIEFPYDNDTRLGTVTAVIDTGINFTDGEISVGNNNLIDFLGKENKKLQDVYEQLLNKPLLTKEIKGFTKDTKGI